MKPETLRDVRKTKLRLSQAELAGLLGYSSRQLGKMEQGRVEIPEWMKYALAWLLLHGPADPFDGQT